MTEIGDSLGDRRKRLDDEVEKLALAGWRIRMRRDDRVVLAKVSHLPMWANLLLTVVTAGLWIFVVIIWGLAPPEERCVVGLDADGRVLQTPGKR